MHHIFVMVSTAVFIFVIFVSYSGFIFCSFNCIKVGFYLSNCNNELYALMLDNSMFLEDTTYYSHLQVVSPLNTVELWISVQEFNY